MTKQELRGLSVKYLQVQDRLIVDRITQFVYNRVIHQARYAMSSNVVWNMDDYVFENPGSIKLIHMVSACSRLHELFPDSKITRSKPFEITINWGDD